MLIGVISVLSFFKHREKQRRTEKSRECLGILGTKNSKTPKLFLLLGITGSIRDHYGFFQY